MDTVTLKSQVYDGRYLQLTCTQTPDVAENVSHIRWTLKATGGNASWYSTGPTRVSIGGTQVYYSPRKSYSTKVFPAAKGSVSGQLTVPHDPDGTLSVTLSLATAIYEPDVVETTEHWELTPIQRTSGIRAADGLIGSCATVVVSRRDESFRHAIGYRFGQLSGWLSATGDPVAEPVIFSENTLNFLLPETFYGQIPDRQRDSCTLTCITYRGEEPVGQEECSFWVSADPAVCCPVVTGQVFPVDGLTCSLTDGSLIPGISTACCQVTAVAQKGASLVTLTAGEVTVEAGQALLPGWALPGVPVVAVDSRGFETRLSVPSPCIPYVQLTLIPEVHRPEPTADRAVLTVTGACFQGNFGQVENSLTAQVEFDGQRLQLPLEMGETGYRAEVELPNLSYTRNYPVTVTVADRAMTVTGQVTVRKGIPVFDWGEGDFCFHVPVELPALTIGGVPLADYIRNL